MNPPSALFGAMNKERKPFTYTPGGLDLSEIKSERMAQRLMRNAMSEGVPETQVQPIQSPPPQLNSCALPNFNCLPVQVFPTFPLPANPKSLLRSRSNPDPSKGANPSKNIAPVPSLPISDEKPNTDEWKNINKPSLFTLSNNNRPSSINEGKSTSNNSSSLQTTNYGSVGHTEIKLPEKSYDAEYFVMEPQGNIQLMENKSDKLQNNTTICQHNSSLPSSNIFVDPATTNETNPVALTSSPSQETPTNDIEQKKVKIVKKQTKTSENEADQNGDTEAAVVVKLPSKKSSAKTETKVEVLKKTLPDGTVEEVKKTITKTTIDGKTEIKTETETRVLPKEDDEIVEIEEQEEENEDVVVEENENEQNEESFVEESTTVTTKELSENKSTESEEESNKTEIKENGHIISGEEKTEISTTKKVVVIQSAEKEPEEEQEEEIEEEMEDGDVEIKQVIVLKKVEDNKTESSNEVNSDDKLETTADVVEEEEEEEVEEEEVADEENVEDKHENVQENDKKDTEEPEEDKEVEAEEVEAEEVEAEEVEAEEVEAEEVEAEEERDEEAIDVKEQNEDKDRTQKNEKITITSEEKTEEDAEEEYEEAEDVPIKTELTEKIAEGTNNESTVIKEETEKIEKGSELSEKVATNQEPSSESSVPKEDITKQKTDEQERVVKITFQSEPKVLFREPSIPLEKVEDVEIKPIGPAQEIIKKCHTEIITTTKDEPTGALSTQTNYNRIENIVTVNRTTKILDHAYEQAETTIPASVNPYYVPPNICPPDRILTTPQPMSRSYQPIYTSEPQTERRHSLLLDRLSVDRQIPVQQPDVYQNNYQYNSQSYEQNQWSQEPQSEVLTVSNVKPSTITKNQQWYQQSKRDDNNFSSNIVTPTPIMPSQLSQPQFQPKPKPQQQPQPQAQPQYQTYVQPQYTPKQEFQPAYTDNSKQNIFQSNTPNFQQNIYQSYTPKPSWVTSTIDSKPTPAAQYNQYSTLKKETSESYQKTTQPFSSSYVPPPWEQDSSYVADNQNFYQPSPATTYTPSTNQSWKPKQPASKYSKPPPKAYIPPAPNQSFVKPVSSADAQILPGRKTYYSEYERRYISVPESTYIPSETKYQAQPDPSPQYYFDNNEPSETVEPQWRKELREFTEKTSQTTTTQTEKISVKPPWEEDPKYVTGYNTYSSTTVTPSWTQTLRPRSWRETSYEPEYIGSKEWPKTNTLGRGRPQSSYVRSNVETVRERTRGVSVDRYNPNSYQSPLSSEHPPVQSHTLNANIHPKTYHKPSVPAYHARTSAESREQTAPYTQRTWAESKAPPVQSRSFKYLQWITGTED